MPDHGIGEIRDHLRSVPIGSGCSSSLAIEHDGFAEALGATRTGDMREPETESERSDHASPQLGAAWVREFIFDENDNTRLRKVTSGSLSSRAIRLR